MTINKSQGQSVSYVSLDLHSPVFAHGKLYVALSHCTSGHRIKVLFPEGEQGTSTFNVVYPEVLQHILVSFIPHSLFIFLTFLIFTASMMVSVVSRSEVFGKLYSSLLTHYS